VSRNDRGEKIILSVFFSNHRVALCADIHVCVCASGAYFCVNMVLITLSTFIAVVIIQTHIRGDRKNKVPPWLKRVSAVVTTFDCLFSEVAIKLFLSANTTNASQMQFSSTSNMLLL